MTPFSLKSLTLFSRSKVSCDKVHGAKLEACQPCQSEKVISNLWNGRRGRRPRALIIAKGIRRMQCSFTRNNGQKPDGNQEPGHSSPHYSHETCNLSSHSMAIGEEDLEHLHGKINEKSPSREDV